MRDPRINPRPGDLLLFGPQWQLERYDVIGVLNGRVHYLMNGAALYCTIADWRKWAATAEVLEKAKDQAGQEAM